MIEEIKKTIEMGIEASKGISGSAKWTENLNKSFIEFAHKKGLCAYSKTSGSDWGEWLYDLTVCSQKDSFLDEAVLVMESEWKSDDQSVFEDFQKLLLCNSSYKVMVYYNNREITKDMKKQIAGYKGANGTFILACFTDSDGLLMETVEAGN